MDMYITKHYKSRQTSVLYDSTYIFVKVTFGPLGFWMEERWNFVFSKTLVLCDMKEGA